MIKYSKFDEFGRILITGSGPGPANPEIDWTVPVMSDPNTDWVDRNLAVELHRNSEFIEDGPDGPMSSRILVDWPSCIKKKNPCSAIVSGSHAGETLAHPVADFLVVEGVSAGTIINVHSHSAQEFEVTEETNVVTLSLPEPGAYRVIVDNPRQIVGEWTVNAF